MDLSADNNNPHEDSIVKEEGDTSDGANNNNNNNNDDDDVPMNEEGKEQEQEEVLELPRAVDLLFANENEKKLYWDRSHYDSPESQMRALSLSKTLYIGNLAFSTRSAHLRNHFSECGPVHKIHMGLDRFRKTPCGFAFVEYYRRIDAMLAVAHLSQTKLDGRVIRVELDAGFQPGRQYGRGLSGGQVRDDRRSNYDPARAGQRHRPKWTPPTPITSTSSGTNIIKEDSPEEEETAVPPPTTSNWDDEEEDVKPSIVKKEDDTTTTNMDQDMEVNNKRYREDGM